jgi:hypothetical protein
MAIHGQPTAWTCGPFALKHALLAHGVFAREDDLGRLAGTSEAVGTDEHGLGRAARAHGATLLVRRETAIDPARRALEGWLSQSIPVLLCLDQWDHWVTAVTADRDHVVLFDSKYDAPLRAEGWEVVLGRLGFHRRRLRGWWNQTLYDLHPLVTARPASLRLQLTIARARYLLSDENGDLARRWDEYASGLFALAVTPGWQLELGHALEDFIQARRSAILDHAVALSPVVTRPLAARVVDGLAFAAGLYRAVLRPEAEPGAVPQLGELVVQLVLRDAAPVMTRSAAA